MLQATGRLDEAAASYRRALVLKPDFIAALVRLGGTLRDLGQIEAAEARFREALVLNPHLAEVHHNLAVTLRLQSRTAEAEASCRVALTLAPTLVAAIIFLARLQVDRGNFSEAEALFTQAISFDPESPEAWSGIPTTRKMTLRDTAWAQSTQQIADRCPLPRREARLRYAIGKYFDDVRQFDRAFESYRRANDLTKRYLPRHDRAHLAEFVERIIQTDGPSPPSARPRESTAPPLESAEPQSESAAPRGEAAAPPGESAAPRRPVLVVGMPRSGTTLAEQLLASHPGVFGAGELPFWGVALNTSLQDSEPYREALTRPLAEDYMRLLAKISPDASHVIDKMPTNFLSIGLIHAAMPQARIIHMRRNPLDTCLSLYFQDFEAAYSYTNDLDDLAHGYTEYARLMTHWRTVLAEDVMLDVPYEGLIDDSEGWRRRMLEFIGLPGNLISTEARRSDRVITSVSSWQARQPIYASSVERWRHYASHIGPLLSLVDHDPRETIASSRVSPALI